MRIVPVALLGLLPVLGDAQPAPTTVDPAFSSVNGAFAALYVSDIEASIRWYSEKLGLRTRTPPTRYQQTTVAVLAGGGLELELLHHADAKVASASDVPPLGFAKFGFVVGDFAKTLATLRARGVPIFMGPFPPRPTQRANFLIRDNEGNVLQLFGEFSK